MHEHDRQTDRPWNGNTNHNKWNQLSMMSPDNTTNNISISDSDHVCFDELLEFEHGLLASQHRCLRPRLESFLARRHRCLHLGSCGLRHSRHQFIGSLLNVNHHTNQACNLDSEITLKPGAKQLTEMLSAHYCKHSSVISLSNISNKTRWALALLVLVSCARLSWSHLAFESTLTSSIISYHISIIIRTCV